MTMERFILIAITVISIASILYIPKEKYRLALIAYLAFQTTTWAHIIMLVQKGTLEFPVREFVKATRVNFTSQFLFYPAIFAWFILLYPKKPGFMKKLLHYLVFVSIIVWFIYFISIYTDLENFAKGTKTSQVIRMYIGFTIQYIICHIYVIWFSRKTNIS